LQHATQTVQVTGHWIDKPFLLDNQINQKQMGYQHFTPFKTTTGILIMVNQGWVRGNANRTILPDLPPLPVGLQTLTGCFFPASINRWVSRPLETPLTSPPTWPIRFQKWDWALFEQVLEQPLMREVLYLKNFPAPSTSPQKHRAYAVQWFLLALVLPILVYFRHDT
jgi:surfeit locus 1 family protein